MDRSTASIFSFLLLPARFSSSTTAPSFYLAYKLFSKSLALVCCCAINSECEQGCSQVVAMNSQLDEGNYSFLLLRSRYFSIDSALLTLPCLFFLFFSPPPYLFAPSHLFLHPSCSPCLSSSFNQGFLVYVV